MSTLQQELLPHAEEGIISVRDQVRKHELNAVVLKDVPWIKYKDGKKIVEMTIDSGAAATVAPRGASDDDLIETSRNKIEVFATASGHRMPNYGGQRIKAMSNSGIGMNITAQVTDVKKPLISVQEMCCKGDHVIFQENRPIIRSEKSGIEIEMAQRNDQYLIELEIAVIGSTSAAAGSTFSRPEYLL